MIVAMRNSDLPAGAILSCRRIDGAEKDRIGAGKDFDDGPSRRDA